MPLNKLISAILITFLITGCTRPVVPTNTPAASPSPEPSPTPTTVPKPTTTYSPAFEVTECPFEVPKGYAPICGYLTVPEDRSQADGRTIRLAIAVFKSTSANPEPDPVIHLAGGPGSSPLGATPFILKNGGNDILAHRDYILLDQRGVGNSLPNLYCQPYDEYLWDAHELDLSLDEYNAGAFPSLEICLTEWRTQGINLASYNSAESAADVNDLRLALGYEQVNLYGTSYGTRLALTVMRDHPEGIRSVIIDSVYPPESNLDLDLALNAERTLALLFSACAESPACTTNYGNLETKFYEVVDRLETNPVQVEVNGPYRSSPYRVYLDGDLWIDMIFGGLYSVGSLADLPGIIQTAYEGRYTELSEIVGGGIGSPLSAGMFWSVFCREEIPFEINITPPPEAEGIPEQLSKHFSEQYALEICQLWNIPAADPVENAPVISDIPTLIFAGQHDPITPPRYAESTAATLNHAYYYLFPNMAHGVMRSDPCALQIGLEFLNNPALEPDISCMASLVGFKLP